MLRAIAICCIFVASFVVPTNTHASSDCTRYGLGFKGLLDTSTCFDISSYIRGELVINDPDNPDSVPDGAEFNARVRSEVKILRETEIGTLGAFIRFQADYDPEIFDDLLAGVTSEDFAVGLDAFEISLHRKNSDWQVGEIENAGAVFLSDGFTDRGTESLDARTGLGGSYQRVIWDTKVRFSINDPRESTDAIPVSPNFGIGASRKVGPLVLGAGAALINVDDVSSISTSFGTPRLSGPVILGSRATFGFGLGFDVKYEGEALKTFAGITYTKNAANDVIFSFSDGFDAVSFYAGLSKKISQNLTFNTDVSYVTAVEDGLRDLNGFEAAINLTWQPIANWFLLGEIGLDSVDDFGAGEDFFFNNDKNNTVDFLFQVRRDF
ncbi:MAG: hypothetical protein ABJN24_09650 [Hyphomicrobiales bacterium]